MANKVVYPAIFINDGDYIFVKFPDVEGAFTQGINIQEAYEMAEEVLGVILAQSDNYFTIPSTFKEIADLYPSSEVALIGVDVDDFKRKHRSKTVRRNISIPEWLNDLANLKSINVSKVVTEALKKELKVK